MIASIVLQNLAYTVGAIVAAAILGTVVVLRHRKPTSVESNMDTFNRGLRALSPEAVVSRRRRAPAPAAPVRRPSPGVSSVRTVMPRPADPLVESDPTGEAGTG